MRNRKREVVDVKRTKGEENLWKDKASELVRNGLIRLPSPGKLVLAISVSSDLLIYLPCTETCGVPIYCIL